MPSGSRNQNIGGTGSPIRETSASTSTPLDSELGVGGVDVVGGQDDPGLDAGLVDSRPRRRERDPGTAARRIDLDPAVLVAERNVGALLEAERLVELDRAILVG